MLIILKQSSRSFVDKLDFITSVGHGEGGDSRKRLGLPGAARWASLPSLCIMEPEEGSHEFVVTALHPGVTREQVVAATGWAIRFADQVDTTAEPTETELTALRDLEARTAAAHGQAPGLMREVFIVMPFAHLSAVSAVACPRCVPTTWRRCRSRR